MDADLPVDAFIEIIKVVGKAPSTSGSSRKRKCEKISKIVDAICGQPHTSRDNAEPRDSESERGIE